VLELLDELDERNLERNAHLTELDEVETSFA
jgi:hypothetical protein